MRRLKKRCIKAAYFSTAAIVDWNQQLERNERHGILLPVRCFCHRGYAFLPQLRHQLTVSSAAEAALSSGVNSVSHDTVSQHADSGDFKVILISTGICRVADALPLLEEILGYTSSKAKSLLRAVPVEIAQYLTLAQAQYIAQALTEYGMEVSITNAAGSYVNINDASSSVFDATGNLLPAVAAALATIGIANRMHHITRWTPVGPPTPLFRLGFHRPRPLMHFRRTLFRPAPVRPPVATPPRPPMRRTPPQPFHPQGGHGMGGPRRSPGSGGKGPRGGGFGGGGSFGGGFGGRR